MPTAARITPLLVTLAVALSSLNCASIARHVADDLADKRFSRSFEKQFDFYVNNAGAYRECLDVRGGMCRVDQSLLESGFQPGNALDTTIRRYGSSAEMWGGDDALRESAGIEFAREALGHPVQQSLNDIYNSLGGVRPESVMAGNGEGATPGEIPITFSTDQMTEYIDMIESATLLGGWDGLAAETDFAAEAMAESSPDRESARRQRRLTAFIREYFRAYFRNGRFYKATVDAAELRSEISKRLMSGAPFLEQETADGLVEEIFAGLDFDAAGEQVLFGRIGDDGFVSRGGQAHRFPAVEAKLSVGATLEASVTEVDFVAVGSDLVRVLLHAVFDSHNGLPAVTKSTGAGLCLESSADQCIVRGLEINDPERTNVDPENFESVESWAGRIEGTTSAGIGRVIRGVSWLSLNNEALAGLIETAVGVTLRKSAEKFAWCWYACKMDEPPGGMGGAESFAGFAEAGQTGEHLTIRLTVTAPDATLGQAEE